MHRRQFLLSAAAAALAASVLRIETTQAGATFKKIGVQFFSVPKLLEQDFDGTPGMLKRLGYSEVEFYGPYEFSGPRCDCLMGQSDPAARFFRQRILWSGREEDTRAVGQTWVDGAVNAYRPDHVADEDGTAQRCCACHWRDLRGFAVYSPAKKRKTLDDYKHMVDALNSIGEQAERHGVEFGYHNHGYGLQEMQGQVPLQWLLKGTDPKRVFFEMDIYWTTAGGADPVKLLKEHADRYKMLHMKDMKEHKQFKGDGGDPGQWMELFPYMTTVGDGVIDIKAIVAQAQASGVEHLFVEQDMVANPEAALKRSADYLLKL
jgi:sugar phosphate isomerase/epimerase